MDCPDTTGQVSLGVSYAAAVRLYLELESPQKFSPSCVWQWLLVVHWDLSLGSQPGNTVSMWLGLPHDLALGFSGWASREFGHHYLVCSSLRNGRLPPPHLPELRREPRSQLLMEEWQRPKVRWPGGGISRGCHLWKIKSSTLIWNKQNNTHFIGLFKRLR